MMNDSRNQDAEQMKEKIEIDALLRRIDSLPRLDPRPEDEILGYDKYGPPES